MTALPPTTAEKAAELEALFALTGDGRWLAAAHTLRRPAGTLDNADARRERDRLLRQLAQHFPGSVRSKADAVHEALSRYAATGWQRDQHRLKALTGSGSSVSGLAWLLLKVWRKVPAARTIRDVLSA